MRVYSSVDRGVRSHVPIYSCNQIDQGPPIKHLISLSCTAPAFSPLIYRVLAIIILWHRHPGNPVFFLNRYRRFRQCQQEVVATIASPLAAPLSQALRELDSAWQKPTVTLRRGYKGLTVTNIAVSVHSLLPWMSVWRDSNSVASPAQYAVYNVIYL